MNDRLPKCCTTIKYQRAQMSRQKGNRSGLTPLRLSCIVFLSKEEAAAAAPKGWLHLLDCCEKCNVGPPFQKHTVYGKR